MLGMIQDLEKVKAAYTQVSRNEVAKPFILSGLWFLNPFSSGLIAVDLEMRMQ
jgi:hypothetical protein